ncbi:RNA polymerase sigma factor [Crocinitomix algicola]|uniref:RNA polymerase sigma factor n=1 Tax=Crocinitomix algicola TaxID=1740263 RepID=UPI000832DB74|nr:sigma-70 family RNA polymerase sigma factor [Crocinitomix algicola]
MDQHKVKHIIQSVLKGNHSAFSEIVKAHKDLVFGLSLKISQSQNDAEEISQETFIKIFQQLASFRGQSKLSTWIYRITYFTAINYLKKHKKFVAEPLELESQHPQVKSFDSLSHDEQKRYINKALNRLNPQERAIITCFYLDEFTLKETAEITGNTIGNTKIKLHRTRAKLKTILNELLPQEATMLY